MDPAQWRADKAARLARGEAKAPAVDALPIVGLETALEAESEAEPEAELVVEPVMEPEVETEPTEWRKVTAD